MVENQPASLLTTWTTVGAAFHLVSPGTATNWPRRERVPVDSAADNPNRTVAATFQGESPRRLDRRLCEK